MANAPLPAKGEERRTQAEALAVLRESLRYVDMREIDGRAGVALTWREPWKASGMVRWVAILDAPDDEIVAVQRVHFPNSIASDFWSSYPESVCRNLICPGPRDSDVVANAMTSPGYELGQDVTAWEPLKAEVRAMAREAFETFGISDGLRRLLHLSMDLGVYKDMPTDLHLVRVDSGGPQWELTALTLSHPFLAKAVMKERSFRDLMQCDRTFGEAFRETYPRLTDAHVRRLSGIDVDVVENWTNHHASEVIRLTQMVPPEWMPSGKEWEPFSVIAHVVDGIEKARQYDGAIAPCLAACKGDWSGLLARIKANRPKIGSYESAGTWARSLRRETVGFDDASRHLMNTLVGPLLMHEGVRRGTVGDRDELGFTVSHAQALVGHGLLYGTKSLHGMFEASRRWHSRQAAITADIASANDAVAWPALIAPHRHMGMVAMPVVTGLDLREEGGRGPDRNGVPGMHHCVHTRLPSLLMGDAHVLSIRRELPDGGYERLSTLELRVMPDGTIRQAEHQARGNFVPGVDAQVMAFELQAAFDQGRIEVLPCALAPRRFETQDRFAMVCGYAWRDPGLMANALRAWAPCLPRWMRGLDPAGAYDALVAHGLLAPDWADRLEQQHAELAKALRGG